jgi:hypothetical protein
MTVGCAEDVLKLSFFCNLSSDGATPAILTFSEEDWVPDCEHILIVGFQSAPRF